MSSHRFCFNSGILWIALVSGCGSGKVSTNSSNSSVPNSQKEVVAEADDVLRSAIFQLRPENFGINSNAEKPVSLLNSWRFKQAEKDGTNEQNAAPAAPPPWYSAEKETVLSLPKFDLSDVVHIRDALFFRAISGYLSDRGRDELQRANVVVDFVCRNVSLWKGDEGEIPLTPYSAMFFGRGTAEDRAWVCAEIFRQLRLDSVVIRARSDEKETTDKWLFGVIIDKSIYLYDLRLALPVASGAEGKENVPAKIDEIVNHPEWLELMSAKESYSLKADDLKEPNFYVVSTGLNWCKRMQRLEQVLPAADNCLIYEPLSDEDGKPGLLDRIAKVSGQPVDSLKPWPYLQGFEKRRGENDAKVAQQLQMMGLTFVVPIPFVTDQAGKKIPGTPERKMERYRMMHLLGNYADASQRYLTIRRLEVDKGPAEVERLYKMASEDAFYWTALCKIESADYPVAIDLLSSYLKKYDRNGKWFFSARTLLAETEASQGQLPKAISLLERSSSEDPNQQANAIRLKRWTTGQGK